MNDNLQSKKLLTRRIIYILIALSVIIPLIFKIGLPLKTTVEVEHVYNFIDKLPEGSTVIFSFDHDTATLPEMIPLAESMLRHCFSKNIKVLGLALLAEGAAVGEDNFRRIGNEYNKRYGEDYLFMGYRPQVDVAILGMGENIDRVFPMDYYGEDIRSYPLMNGIINYNDIAAIISVGDGDIPVHWINYAQARYKAKIIPAVTAVMATTIYPFIQSGQVVGLVAGLRGAAEYEKLIGKPGIAVNGMDAQSTAHLLIVGLIIAGNIILVVNRKRNSK
ncbi:MAG: hypothetical protein GY855_06355 [candidate division Zixibacteria bacterium]|nr:hypothetical protein [candidate division Zixibacteria bacterium]